MTNAEFSTTAFAEKWNRTLSRCSEYDLGQTYAWNYHWWNTYKDSGSGAKELFLLVDESDGEIDAIWPLVLRIRRTVRHLHWIGQGDGMITDYAIPIITNRHIHQCVRSFVSYLRSSKNWGIIDISFPSWSEMLSHVIKAIVIHGRNFNSRWKTSVDDHLTRIDLPKRFEEYLTSLGATTRSHVRQYLRNSDEFGASLSIYPATSSPAIEALFALNRERWTVFSSPLARAFMTSALRDVNLASGDAFVATFGNSNVTLSSALCFMQNQTCYIHSAGVTRHPPQNVRFSPGTALYSRLIEYLISKDVSTVDLSPGLEEYKLRLGARVQPILRLTIWRNRAHLLRWHAYRLLLNTKHNAVGIWRSTFAGPSSAANGALS